MDRTEFDNPDARYVLEVRVATTLHNRMTADVREYGKPVHISSPMSSGALSYFAGSGPFESGLLGPLSISVYFGAHE